tara:strand:- start:1374 stop:1685 length:312 start_codon:yes stop_codon:yes gene_type:complete
MGDIVDLDAHRAKTEKEEKEKLDELREHLRNLIPVFDPEQIPWVTPDISKIDQDSASDRALALDSVLDSLTYSMITLDRLGESRWAQLVSEILEEMFGLDEEE